MIRYVGGMTSPSESASGFLRRQGWDFPVVMWFLRCRQSTNTRLIRWKSAFWACTVHESPLPGYYLEDLAWEAGQDLGIRRHFLDFFNHRLVTLFHRSWRKYRYYVRFRPGASDGFSDLIYALVGLGDSRLREATPVNWSRCWRIPG